LTQHCLKICIHCRRIPLGRKIATIGHGQSRDMYCNLIVEFVYQKYYLIIISRLGRSSALAKI
jgi:hypothetical protein